jgi:hypothetical protein
MSLNGRINRVARLLGEGALWDGDKAGMNLAWCPHDIPDDQLSAGALRYRRALELYIAGVSLLIRFRHSEEVARLQATAEALGFDCPWEELAPEEIIQGAMEVAEEKGRRGGDGLLVPGARLVFQPTRLRRGSSPGPLRGPIGSGPPDPGGRGARSAQLLRGGGLVRGRIRTLLGARNGGRGLRTLVVGA